MHLTQPWDPQPGEAMGHGWAQAWDTAGRSHAWGTAGQTFDQGPTVYTQTEYHFHILFEDIHICFPQVRESKRKVRDSGSHGWKRAASRNLA